MLINATKIVIKKDDDSIEVIKNRYGANVATKKDYEYFESGFELKNVIAGTCFKPLSYDKAMFFDALSKTKNREVLKALKEANDDNF